MIITTEGRVGVIRFDRPKKRNALTKAALVALPIAIDQLVESGSRAIILTGSGSIFTAGADLTELSFTEADLDVESGLAAAADRLASVQVPTFAAIEGPCLGAGVELATACDVRVAGQGSTFMIPAARLGILYRPAGVNRLLRTLGAETTRRLLLVNETLGPYGIAGVLVPDGSALATARELADQAAGLVPGAVAATKQLMVEIETSISAGMDWDEVRRRLLKER
ncbi:MAG: enoyl-CoA hydratase/isomerase family protein [Acidimicrobiia bacterium]|nr:enoyl-CoA hydratase/isomerase family protein [Acidimicrobiia bacterium]